MKAACFKRNSAREKSSVSTMFLLVFLAVSSLALNACETCVSGFVTSEGIPLAGVQVLLFTSDSTPMDETWTLETGEYCFEKIPFNLPVRIQAWLDERSTEADLITGNQPSSCNSGMCSWADLTFCEHEDVLEPNNTYDSASPVTLPYSNPLNSLCPAGDVDFYRFEVTEDETIVLAETHYPEVGQYLDSIIGLLDEDGNILARDDDGGDGAYSRIVHTLAQAGTYYLAVTGYSDFDLQGDHSRWGTYGLDIRFTQPSCVQVFVTEADEPLEQARVYSYDFQDSCETASSGSCCFETYVGAEPEYQICHPVTNECVQVSAAPGLPGTCEEETCEEVLFDFNYTCVSGTVTRDGEPVENAEVWSPYGFGYTRTGPDGAYCLLVHADTEITVIVYDPLYWVYYEEDVVTGSGGNCEEGGCTTLDIELPGMTCVSGTVFRGNEPAPGIWVHGPVNSVVTDADGTYCLDVPENSEIFLYLYDPLSGDYLEQPVTTGEGGSCEEGGCTSADFQLPGTACIQGIVTREGETPAPLVEVCVWPGECVTTDQEGRYCLRTLVSASVEVHIYDHVTGEWRQEDVQTGEEGLCSEGSCSTLDVDLPPAACVSGIVVRGSEPQEGVEVCLYGNLCDTTDAQGLYCLPAPVDDNVTVMVRDPLLNQYEYRNVLTGTSGSCTEDNCASLDFTLDEATCISGMVREGTGPLPDAMVFTTSGSVFTDEDGMYCLPAPADEQTWIRAVHPADNSEILRYPVTGSGGSCDQGGCTTQNFTFDLLRLL